MFNVDLNLYNQSQTISPPSPNSRLRRFFPDGNCNHAASPPLILPSISIAIHGWSDRSPPSYNTLPVGDVATLLFFFPTLLSPDFHRPSTLPLIPPLLQHNLSTHSSVSLFPHQPCLRSSFWQRDQTSASNIQSVDSHTINHNRCIRSNTYQISAQIIKYLFSTPLSICTLIFNSHEYFIIYFTGFFIYFSFS